MLSVGAREKDGMSIKYSVMALCEISHSQICDPESVRFFFLFFLLVCLFRSFFLYFAFGWLSWF